MNADTLAEIYERDSAALVAFAGSMVGPSHAEDVVSAAVLSALTSSQSYDNVSGILYVAVSACAKKHWRTLGRRQRREALALRQSSPVNHTTEEAHDDALVSALGRLSVQQRAVAYLRYWEDLTASQIAERLGVSEGTIRRQLARANQRLAHVMEGDDQ